MPSYRISEKAIEDLGRIWLYTLQNWSLQQADRYYHLLIAEFDYLCENYESGSSNTSKRDILCQK